MTTDLNTIIALILGLIIAITLHEFAHALVGYWLGDDTARHDGRLSLNPLASVDPFMTIILPLSMLLIGGPVFAAAKPVPFTPSRLRWGSFGAALVALGGPLMNFLLAAIFGLALAFLSATGPVASLLFTIIYVNVSLGVFNLIPFPPLDGSRVVYALVPPLRYYMDWVESKGLLVFFAIFFFGYQLISPFVSFAVNIVVGLIVPGPTLP